MLFNLSDGWSSQKKISSQIEVKFVFDLNQISNVLELQLNFADLFLNKKN